MSWQACTGPFKGIFQHLLQKKDVVRHISCGAKDVQWAVL